MPKVDDLVTALARLKEQYVKNKLPQVGFFSTLDELIGEAPFEKAPFEQWKNYLKPGRTLEREGVRFPLKQEELEYTFGHPHAQDPEGDVYRAPTSVMTKDELRQWVRQLRPDFRLNAAIDVPTADRWGGQNYLREKRFPQEYEIQEDLSRTPKWVEEKVDYSNTREAPHVLGARWGEYAHEVPPELYEESAIRSTDFGPHETHFGPDVLSHSRTTIHNTPDEKLLRLVEEIQSDRHQAAAERLPSPLQRQNPMFEPRGLDSHSGPRRGYLTPEDERKLRELRKATRVRNVGLVYGPVAQVAERKRVESLLPEIRELESRVPDAPFKDPADYSMLELKNQLINASKEGQDYLGIVSGKDVSNRFGQEAEEAAGTSHIYDKVYPSQLSKLARQYGAKVQPVSLPLEGQADIRPEIMRDLDVEDMRGFVDMVVDRGETTSDNSEYLDDVFGTVDELLSEFQKGLTTDQTPRHLVSAVEGYIQKAKTKKHNLKVATKRWSEIVPGDDPEEPAEAAARAGLNNAKMELEEVLGQLWSIWGTTHEGPTTTLNKEFKAMQLTPEIRDKIRRVGVPIWSLTPAAMLGLGANEEDTGFAEGGSVDSDLSYLRKLAAGLADREEGSEERNRRMNAGWASQMYGLDSEGKMSLFGGVNLADVLIPQRILESYRRNIKGEPDVKKYGPGLLDEVRSLFLGTQGAEEADARLVELRRRINEQLELDEAHGFQENFDEALGVMGGQLPVPGTAAAKLVPKSKLKALLKTLPEWFTPTVSPSPGNYLSGATVGGGLGTLADEEPELPTERVRKAEGGKVEASDTAGINQMIGMLQHRLKMLSTGMPEMPALDSMPGSNPEQLEMAKGGKIGNVVSILGKLREKQKANEQKQKTDILRRDLFELAQEEGWAEEDELENADLFLKKLMRMSEAGGTDPAILLEEMRKGEIPFDRFVDWQTGDPEIDEAFGADYDEVDDLIESMGTDDPDEISRGIRTTLTGPRSVPKPSAPAAGGPEDLESEDDDVRTAAVLRWFKQVSDSLEDE